MSMAKLAKLGVARELQESNHPDHRPGPDVTNDSYAERVAAFIPSEVVAIYIALVGIFATNTMAVRWWLFGIGLVLVPLFAWLHFTLIRRKTSPPPPRKPRVFLLLLLLAAVAYVGWAAALPSTPFAQFTNQATQIGAAAVLILSSLLPQLADVFGVTPDADSGRRRR